MSEFEPEQWPSPPHAPSLGGPPSDSTPRAPLQLTGLEGEGRIAPPAITDVLPAAPPSVKRAPRGGVVGRLRGLLSAQDGYGAMIARLLKSSGLYAIASMGSPLISLVLSPFLAHNLTKADYGYFATLVTVISLSCGISQLGLGSAFFRAYNYDFTGKEERRSVLATVIALLVVGLIPVELLFVLLSPTVAGVFLGDQQLADLIWIAAGVVLVQNLAVPVMAWMRAEDWALSYSLLALTNLLVNLGMNILLVGVFQLGIRGALFSIGAGYLTIILIVLPRILIRSRLHMRRDIAWSMLAFGVPQVGSVISIWVLQVSDRELLLHFKGPAVTAGYSVAYTLGGVLSTLVISPFQLAWPTTMYAIAKRADAGRVFALIFRYLGYLLLLAAFALSLFSSLLLDVLFPKSYESAALVIPIVALSIAFYGAYILFMTGVSLRRLTWLATLFATAAALVNLGLNVVLIPRFSTMGAAASTLIAYVLLSLICYAVNQRIYPVPYEIGRFLLLALIGGIIFAACYAGAQMLGKWSHWPLSIGGFLLYASVLGVLVWRGLRAHPKPAPTLSM